MLQGNLNDSKKLALAKGVSLSSKTSLIRIPAGLKAIIIPRIKLKMTVKSLYLTAFGCEEE